MVNDANIHHPRDLSIMIRDFFDTAQHSFPLDYLKFAWCCGRF